MKKDEHGRGKTFLHISSRMASFGVYVPDQSELLKLIQERADAEHDGKVSAYARAAIERDLSGERQADAMSPNVLVELTRRLCGELTAETMARAMQGRDQRRELKRLLLAVAHEFEESLLQAAESSQAPYGKTDQPITPPQNPKPLSQVVHEALGSEIDRKSHKPTPAPHK